MVQPTLQEMILKEAHESLSSNSRGPTHEERRLQIEELDEWKTHKPRTHDKLKLRQNELDTFPNQLHIGNKVLLEAGDPHIVTARPDEEIPLTVLSIFPFSTVEVRHPKFGSFKELVVETSRTTMTIQRRGTMSSSRGKKTTVPTLKKRKAASSFAGPTTEIRHRLLQFPRGPQEELFQILRARPLIVGCCISWDTVEQLFFGIIEPTYLELTMELCSTFHLQTVMTNYDDPGTVQFHLSRLIHQLSIPEFGAALGLYTEEFKEENELHAPTCHIHFSPSKYWHTLAPGAAFYNPSRSKALVLPPSLRHVIDLAYFITLMIQYQTERHRNGVISIGPYVTQLARHFGLLSTVAQESSLTLIGQLSPQGISSMLSMRMIEKHRGTYPSQYRLTQSTKEEAYEDIPDNVPPQHEDLLSQPLPPSCPVHAAVSYADISEYLARFEQQCFQ
ncbi:hypothetical protein GOBAR_AA15081 [Gossypium barbadense]|uniref:Uncharacterized protein n=1 Tax=Gossypium barbadense TaxID=3634 RepID=A0A2P5XQF0_GOSBA|nr:hypothetical protein GOBAR_AA15081 [Gossypium barbadense]